MSKLQGRPFWYELATGKGKLAAAGSFYAGVMGWETRDSGMEGFEYRLAVSDGDLVAGIMEMPPDVCEMPPFWMIYFAVDDVDKTVTDITAAGGSVHRQPEDIPGTGRFAIAADPQGAAFGILQPLPAEEGGEGNAFDQDKLGHANWHELMSTDPEAGFAFYAAGFGQAFPGSDSSEDERSASLQRFRQEKYRERLSYPSSGPE